ncbi:NAD-dependent epimerase/dehydratase family protein [Bdellovibrio bacteriovorus]|uniref:NAD-dependent epimerase/dehydratase family protein n=1 Tax=Bdellovibrio bacteriovorus TaxID=959 RepID=UPI0035A5C1F1
MTYPTNICIAGATGLVGHELLLLLAHLDEVRSIKAVSRSPMGRIPPHVENIILDFDNLEARQDVLKADIFICCLGTTIKKAGSQEAFRKVDFDYVVNFAKVAEACGAQKFLVISALGADADSSIFYNRVKGEMENELRKLKIPQIEIFQPSLILGERKESRKGEDFAQKLSPMLNKILVGPLKKYRAIKANTIARAMAIATLNFHPGFHVYKSDHIQRIADQK